MQFVLVHGAWFGGWCWQAVERRLRGAGHDVYAPTLTGLGERSHLASPEVDASTHVQDVVNAIVWNDFRDIVLVGHSYGGLVISVVASRVAERIATLVYLDAFLLEESGLCLFDISPPARVAELEAAAAAFNGWQVPPDVLIPIWSREPRARALLERYATPHPIACFRERLTLSGAEKTIPGRAYILCEAYNPSPFWPFYESCRQRPNWRSSRIPCLHDAMLAMPDVVAAALLEAAGTGGVTHAARS